MTVSESDPRSIRTRELLRQALINLAAEKRFSSLTVQEVTNRTGLNRTMQTSMTRNMFSF